jgi:hypothetical protein
MAIDDKLEKVLEWISPGTRNEAHDAKRVERAEGTGDWLFKSEQFRNWVTGEGSKLLFCHGIGIYPFITLLGLMLNSWNRKVGSDVTQLGNNLC